MGLNDENGGLTVEAALALPMFLTFLFAMLVMTRIAMAATALHIATTDTVKMVSAHLYPIQQLAGTFDDKWKESIPESLRPFVSLLPHWQDLAQPLLCSALTPVVGTFADTQGLKKNNITVTKVALPESQSAGEPYFGIETEYVLLLPVPFMHKEIRLRSAAKERAWVGDSS